MTKHELSLIQSVVQEIYDRKGDEYITNLQYRDYSSQMTGMYKLLHSIGYIIDIDYGERRVIICKDQNIV